MPDIIDSDDSVQHLLTTVDNPFDPFTQFDEWLAYDTREGWHTLSYLARVVHSSHELSDEDQRIAFERAIEDIIKNDEFGVYVRVTADTAGAIASAASNTTQ